MAMDRGYINSCRRIDECATGDAEITRLRAALDAAQREREEWRERFKQEVSDRAAARTADYVALRQLVADNARLVARVTALEGALGKMLEFFGDECPRPCKHFDCAAARDARRALTPTSPSA